MNLHGNNPASTSSQTLSTDALKGQPVVGRWLPDGLGPEPLAVLTGEAQALLDLAASQRTPELERLRAFARACLELSDAGRLALAVLDGGLFAPRRALELARLVVGDPVHERRVVPPTQERSGA